MLFLLLFLLGMHYLPPTTRVTSSKSSDVHFWDLRGVERMRRKSTGTVWLTVRLRLGLDASFGQLLDLRGREAVDQGGIMAGVAGHDGKERRRERKRERGQTWLGAKLDGMLFGGGVDLRGHSRTHVRRSQHGCVCIT